MELPRILHDELLHKVDEPHDQHLAEVLHAAEVYVPVKDRQRAHLGEHSPLIKPTPSGKHLVIVDVDRVEAILDAEERAAVAADAALGTWDIVKQEAVMLAKLAVPMIMAALLEFLPEMLLTMMIGHVDPSQSAQILAAFSLSGLVQMLLVAGLLNGLSSAIDTLCSQAFGAKKMTELWLFCQAGFLMYAICMPFMLVGLLSGSQLLKALGQDPAIADIAGQFLLVNTLVIPFGVLFFVMKSALQAQNIVFPFVTASLIAWLVSGSAAYVLAFHTPLGYLGIAAANPLCWLIKSLVLLPVIANNPVFQASWPGWRPKEAMALVPKISKLGVSSVLMTTLQMLGFSSIALFAGLLPNASIMITANSIFNTLIVLSFMPLLGICIGGAIRMGNALGAGQARRAALIGRIVMLLAAKFNFVCMFVVGVPCGLFFALRLGAGLTGLWLGNMVGLFVFMLAGLVWLAGLNWEGLAHEAKHNTSLHFAKAPAAA
ncbi:hypothetical protein PybrP1_006545 [[Pythium] brassicae (nom. inval.)]|nr:hypothetical protein PybrP1_006545 [[Pythium] brassicae (nom. inval.)]